jgi:hypothetical protein
MSGSSKTLTMTSLGSASCTCSRSATVKISGEQVWCDLAAIQRQLA